MAREEKRRVDVDGVTLLWGNAVEWKAAIREESRLPKDRPLDQRLLAALALVRRRCDRER